MMLAQFVFIVLVAIAIQTQFAFAAAVKCAPKSKTTSVSDSTSTTTATSCPTASTTGAWAYSGIDVDYPGLSDLPDDIDAYDAYTKIFASKEDGIITWWYNGIGTAVAEGLPEVQTIGANTLMAFRIKHYNSTSMRIDWTEVVLIADAATREPITYYYDPITGTNLTQSNYYYDGPVTYYISKDGKGIKLDIVQKNANITSTSVTGKLYQNRVIFTHVEKKDRPVTGSSTPAKVVSTLMPIGDLDDVRNSSLTSVKASGYYFAYFKGGMSTSYGYPSGTQGESRVMGNFFKGAVDEQIYPTLWARYKEHFPEFFDGDKVSPNWTSILGE